MPIIYQNTNKQMNKHTEVSQEELDLMRIHHRKFEYTPDEQMQVFNLVRKYLNPHQSTCTSCSNNLRDAKTALNSFYLQHEADILNRLNLEQNAPIEAQESKPEPRKKRKRINEK